MTKENTYNMEEEFQKQEREEQQEKNQNREEKRKEFFSMVEDRFFDWGKKILKNGVTNIAMAQLHNTEEKIKSELEGKYKQYQTKALQSALLFIGAVFFAYGLVSLIFYKIGISEWTNVIFGLIFLITYFIVKNKS